MRAAGRVVVALALLLSACGPPKPKGVAVDAALESLVPRNAVFLLGADLNAIRTTHVFQKYLGAVKMPQLEQFVRDTGIDPRRDLWQVLSCYDGTSPLLLARGKFSSGKQAPAISGAQRMEYKGRPLFGDERSAVLFLDGSTAAAGRAPDLRNLVDTRDGRRGLPPALRAKLDTIGANNQVWAVFAGGMQSLNLGLPEESNIGQVLRMFRGLDGGTIAMDLRNGFRFRAVLECHGPKDAKQVHDALRGVIGIGRLSTPNSQMEMLKLYDAIHVTQEQAKVAIAADVPPELEDKFLDLWLKAR